MQDVLTKEEMDMRLNFEDEVLREKQVIGYDESYVVRYFSSWSSYEDYAWMAIFEKEGKFYEMSGGYAAGASANPQDFQEFSEAIYEIDLETAINEIKEFEEVRNSVAQQMQGF